ncbi:MAG: hypothetical protein O7H41_21055 [Planctomycetota bacterium]|nr:hypothetical protein [Planctomycetota bacterium]
MRFTGWVLCLTAGWALALPACSEKHDPFWREEPTFTVEVTADPPGSLRDQDTYGYWTFPATVRFEGVRLVGLEEGGEFHIGGASSYGYDFHVEAVPAEEIWSLMEEPMVMGDDGHFVHEWHIDGVPHDQTAAAPAAGYILYASILDETPGPGESTISLYSDMGRTQLVAEGSGPDDSVVTLNEMNASGISGEAHVEEVTGDNSSIMLMFNMWMKDDRGPDKTHHLMVKIGASAATGHVPENLFDDVPTYHHVELSLIEQATSIAWLDDEVLEVVQTEEGPRFAGNFDLGALPIGAYDVHLHVAVPEMKRDAESIMKWLAEIEFEFENLDWDGSQFTPAAPLSFPLALPNSPDDDLLAILAVGTPIMLIDRGLVVSPSASENISFSLALLDPEVPPGGSVQLPYGNVKVVVINELNQARLETTLSPMYGGEHGFHFARNIALPLAGEVVEEEGGGGHDH